VLVGHDWGAPIVWNTAIRHPDGVRAVAGLSVPHVPASGTSIVDLLDLPYADKFLYMLHFQEPGVAEAEFAVQVYTGQLANLDAIDWAHSKGFTDLAKHLDQLYGS
jgi:pimeloyl-ACP methyl ester carboxylesterase